MKLQHLVALGASLALPTSNTFAQAAPAPASSVSIYGIVDVGVDYLTNVGPSKSGLFRMPNNTSSTPSRLGFRGTEDLGGGLAAVFTMEMGFGPDTGSLNQGGRVFGRQAFVGLQGPWGTVTAGRIYSMHFFSGSEADVLGPISFGMASLDPYPPNARMDNAIGWRGRFGAWDVGATYSLGRDAVNAGPSPAGTNCPGESTTDSKACRAWSAMAKYVTPAWGATVAFDRQHGRTLGPAPDAIFGGLNSSDKTDDRLSVNGYVVFGNTKVGAGVVRRDNDGLAAAPRSNLWFLGAQTPITPQTSVAVQAMSLRFPGASERNSTILTGLVNHQLSRRTAIYGQVGRISNGSAAARSVSGAATGGNPATGVSQSGLNAGIRHSF